METLNKYLGMLPTIKNSPMAVASTELGNVPFTKATHASIMLSHLPVAWRNQYDLIVLSGELGYDWTAFLDVRKQYVDVIEIR